MELTKRKERKPDKRLAESRKALREALLELLRDHNFREISVVMITRRASVGYATFFRHYSSPEALLIELADAMHQEIRSAVSSLRGDQAPQKAMRIMADYVHENRALAFAMIVRAGSTIQDFVTAQAIVAAEKTFRRAPNGIPVNLAIRHAVAATFLTLAWWLEESDSGPETLADLLTRLVVSPLFDK